MAIETILGGLLGGVFRLAPEVLAWRDRKDARKHDLAMASARKDEAKVSADAQVSTEALKTVSEAIKTQGQLTGIKFVDGWNMLMRPLIATQWVVFLYPGYLFALWHQLVEMGTDEIAAFTQVFGADEKAICAGIISFFFLNRVFNKINGQ
ncbi:MAG: hypothetical protein ACREAE_07495 [Nitrosopumilaceae archaeon]